MHRDCLRHRQGVGHRECEPENEPKFALLSSNVFYIASLHPTFTMMSLSSHFLPLIALYIMLDW